MILTFPGQHDQHVNNLEEDALFRSADYFVKGFTQGPETWVSRSRAPTVSRMESEAPRPFIKTEEREIKLEDVENSVEIKPMKSIRELMKSHKP